MQAQRRTVFKLAGGTAVAAASAVALTGCGTDMYGGGARPRTTNKKQLRVTKGEIPVGSGVIFPDQGYVVTQPVAGQFDAYSDVCPHQGCPVRQVTNEHTIRCLCHNSSFSIADGAVIAGPAPTGLTRAKVKEDGNDLVITSLDA